MGGNRSGFIIKRWKFKVINMPIVFNYIYYIYNESKYVVLNTYKYVLTHTLSLVLRQIAICNVLATSLPVLRVESQNSR